MIKVGDQYAWYDTELLYRFAQAAVEIGATKLYISKHLGSEALYTKSDKGRVMLMPAWNGVHPAVGVYSYKRTGETARYDIEQQAKPEPLNDTRFSIGEPYDVEESPVGRAEPRLNGKTATKDAEHTSIAAELQDKFGVKAEVIEDLDGVRDEQARKHIAAGENVKGWYDLKTGKVYLYALSIASEQDAMATYAHEVIAHKGMRETIGIERYDRLCRRLGASLTEEQRARISPYLHESDAVKGDEYIARIAEMLIDEQGNIKEPTTWEKVKAVVRDFFRDVFGLDLTDADIRYMLWRSGERLRRNKADALTRAQDVETGQKLATRAAIFRIVYHGSGANFDHFDHSHMGEGEGNQAFGWGTYVADLKAIAAEYAEGPDGAVHAEDYVLKADGDYQSEKGFIYEVEIPDIDKGVYLDWASHVAEDFLNRVRSALGDRMRDNILRDSVFGDELYHELDSLLGEPKKASLFLSKLGVTGIRYPAGTLSGKMSVGIFNYVIFNEDDLEIRKVSSPTRVTKRTLDNGITEISIETASGAKEVALFRGGVRHGVTRRWYPNGQLRSETDYKYGRKEGPSRYWYENGQLKQEANYKSDALHGPFVIYLENGNWTTKWFYVNGQLHGWEIARGYYSPSETLEYYEHGKKLREIY